MKDTAQTALTLAKRTQARAIFLVLLAGSLWGCIGLFSRTLSALGVGPETIVILRNAGACVVLAVLFLLYDRSIFRIQLRHFPIFLGTGIVSILFFTLCYFNSQQVSSLAVSAILLYTAPLSCCSRPCSGGRRSQSRSSWPLSSPSSAAAAWQGCWAGPWR